MSYTQALFESLRRGASDADAAPDFASSRVAPTPVGDAFSAASLRARVEALEEHNASLVRYMCGPKRASPLHPLTRATNL